MCHWSIYFGFNHGSFSIPEKCFQWPCLCFLLVHVHLGYGTKMCYHGLILLPKNVEGPPQLI